MIKKDKFNYFIIGAGAVGRGLAGFFQLNSLPVNVFSREGRVEASYDYSNDCHYSDIQLKNLSIASNRTNVIFVATRQIDFIESCNQYLKCFSKYDYVIPLCNGWNFEMYENAMLKFPDFRWVAGATTLAAKWDSLQNKVTITSHEPEILLSPFNTSSTFVSELKNDLKKISNLSVVNVSTPRSLIEGKWIVNIMINVLSAYHDLKKNGELLNYLDDLKTLSKELADFTDKKFERKKNEKEIYDLAMKVIHSTQENENSLIRDLRVREKTELNSYIKPLLEWGSGPMLGSICKKLSRLSN